MMTRWICPEEAESVADAKRRLAKRSGTNTRDDGEAVAFNIDEIMLEAERRHHEWNRPGVTGQTVRPEQAIEYWYALVAHEKAAATLTRQLAEAQGVIERYGKALDEIGQMGPHTAAWSAQTVARVARNPSRSCTTEVIERLIEQCAQTAEAWHPMLYAPEHGGSHPTDSAYRSAREGIARAIRALSPPREQHGDKG